MSKLKVGDKFIIKYKDILSFPIVKVKKEYEYFYIGDDDGKIMKDIWNKDIPLKKNIIYPKDWEFLYQKVEIIKTKK